jgi:hypothetical protein
MGLGLGSAVERDMRRRKMYGVTYDCNRTAEKKATDEHG